MEVKETAALTNPSLRDLPIIIISAWRKTAITSPQTVTFESFLANFNNADRPGGGDGVLELDSGIFTCFTSGYYTVSFSAYAFAARDHAHLYLYKNSLQLPESHWNFAEDSGEHVGVTGSRILASNLEYI